MTEVRTDAIRAFQQKVHTMSSVNQRDLRLTAQEARNLSNELAQISAYLLEIHTLNNTNEPLEVSVTSTKF